MGKDKKKRSKKDKPSEDLLDVAHLSLKKFRKVTKEIAKLSTGQKLVGGLALAAAGLVYLAAQDQEAPAAIAENAPEASEPESAGPVRRRKRPKAD